VTRSTAREGAAFARRAAIAARFAGVIVTWSRAYYWPIAAANELTRRLLTLVAGPGVALLDELVGPGDLAVDVGASRGVFTTRLSELVGPTGRVLAFDPNPECIARLEQIAGTAGNVVVHASALSDAAGVAVLHVPVRSGVRIDALGHLGEPAGDDEITFSVPTVTLDEVLGADNRRVRFVKCDVEGHELAVLRGASTVLESERPTLLVEIEWRHSGEAMQETFDLLRAAGYQGEVVTPAGRRPLSEFDVERDQLAHLDAELEHGAMPRGYLNEFLFTFPAP
jgi:FkbM family methyltransferase